MQYYSIVLNTCTLTFRVLIVQHKNDNKVSGCICTVVDKNIANGNKNILLIEN